MKIAYIFSGHARTWEQCYQSFFENVYEDNPGDIFIHTWNKTNSHFGSHWNNMRLTEEQLKIADQDIDINGIMKAFNPKKILVEKDPSLSVNKSDTTQVNGNHFCNFLLKSSKSAFSMMKTYADYDYVFHSRLDVKHTSKINLNTLDTSCFHITNICSNPNKAYDFCSFGSVYNMDVKTNFVDRHSEYIDDMFANSAYELGLYRYLTDNQIRVCKLSIDFYPVRLF